MEWSKSEIKKYYWTVIKYHLKNIVLMCYWLPLVAVVLWFGIEGDSTVWFVFILVVFMGFGLGIVFGIPTISSLSDVKYRNLMKIDIKIDAIRRIMPQTANEHKLWMIYPFPDKKYILYAENGDEFQMKERMGREYSLNRLVYPITVRLVYCRESKLVVSMIVGDKDFA